jgi:putative methyltransferase
LGQFLFCFAKGGIKIMGYVEMLESADKKMIVEEKGLKITEDALLLSNFLRKYFSKKNKNPKTRKSVILEIGAGQGIMSLLISEIDMVERIIAVEVQKDVYETLEKNIEINNLRQKITPLNENIKNIEGKYEFIFSNPPYKKVNAGKLPDNVTERISKYEILLTLEELFREIRRLLSNYGEFFVIVPNSRLNDVFGYIYANNMNIISIEINKYKKTDLIIVHGRKGGKANSGIVIDF